MKRLTRLSNFLALPKPIFNVVVFSSFASAFSLTNAHAEDSLLPALDDLTHADLELEGLAAVIARVELLAVGQGARVVHREHVPILGHPLAGLGFADVLHAQPARGHLEHTGVTKG